MAYTPTTWTNGSGEPLDATNLNNMEAGIDSAHVFLDAHYIDPATSLPGSPADKQRALLVDSLTAPTYAWLFQYESGISDANKWLFIGGAPASAEVLTAQDRNSTSYGDLATVHSIALARAGVYELAFGFQGTVDSGVNNNLWMSPKYSGSEAVDNDATTVINTSAGGVDTDSSSRILRVTVGASQTITMRHRNSTAAAGTTFSRRWLKITPVRVA